MRLGGVRGGGTEQMEPLRSRVSLCGPSAPLSGQSAEPKVSVSQCMRTCFICTKHNRPSLQLFQSQRCACVGFCGGIVMVALSVTGFRRCRLATQPLRHALLVLE